MSNFSVSNASLSTSDFNIEEAPVALTIVLLSISLWIIIVNGLVFSCLITSRNAMKTYVNLQLLSLSLTDMLVGLFSIPVTLTFKITGSFPKYEVCASLFYLYISSQGATMNHALVICIHRLITVQRKASRDRSIIKLNYKSVYLQILAIWIVCFIIVSIPFLAFGRYGETLVSCSLNSLFEDNYSVAIGVFTFALLPPHICLNIVYVYMFVHLKRKWKQIEVACTATIPYKKDNLIENTYSREQDTENSNGDTSSKLFMVSGQENTGVCANTSPKKCLALKGSKNNELMNSPTKKSQQSNFKLTTFSTEHAWERKRRNFTRGKSRASGRLAGLVGQKKVLMTIGILLIILNVFMTPLDCLTLFEFLHSGYLSRSVKFIFMAMAIFNSALNPIINMLRIKPFQVFLKQKALRLYNILSRRL